MAITVKTHVSIWVMVLIITGIVGFATYIEAKYATKEYVATIKEDIKEMKEDVDWLALKFGKPAKEAN